MAGPPDDAGQLRVVVERRVGARPRNLVARSEDPFAPEWREVGDQEAGLSNPELAGYVRLHESNTGGVERGAAVAGDERFQGGGEGRVTDRVGQVHDDPLHQRAEAPGASTEVGHESHGQGPG